MAKNRWFKTFVSITDNFLWKLTEPFDKRSAFIDLIAQAEYKGGKKYYTGSAWIKVNRGEIVTTRTALCERWHWSQEELDGFLDILKNEGMANTTNYVGIIVIELVNYVKYQSAKTNMFNDFKQRSIDLNELIEGEIYG